MLPLKPQAAQDNRRHPFLSIEQFIFAGLIFFAAHMLSTITGFGPGVLGVPLLAMVVGIDPGKTVTRRPRDGALRLRGGPTSLEDRLARTGGNCTDQRNRSRRRHRSDRPSSRPGSNVLLAIFVMVVGAAWAVRCGANCTARCGSAGFFCSRAGSHGKVTTGGCHSSSSTLRGLPHKSDFATLAVMW